MKVPSSIFKAYDIRGIVETELTPEIVKLIGRAVGSESIKKGERGVVVGRDGRLSGPELSEALISGLIESGCHVVNIGMVPSPVVYFATHTKAASSGVMITGSHNPAEYNGLKIMIAGETLSAERIQDLYSRILESDFSNGHGTSTSINIDQDYIDTIKSDIKLEKELKVVIDCGNGVAGSIAPKLFEALGVKVSKLFCLVDGRFPNHHPDPSKPENLEDLIQEVIETDADLGLAFDGDGDRLGVVDNLGNIVWADQYMLILCSEISKLYNNPKVIMDVKCSKIFFDEAKKMGCDPIMSKTGHSPIKEKMKELKSPLSGEMSGHVCYGDDFYGYDDAMYVALRLLRILSNSKNKLSDMINEFPKTFSTPETRFDVEEIKKFQIIDDIKKRLSSFDGNLIDIDGIRLENNYGWFLMRASNTQNQLTCRAESTSEQGLRKLVNVIEDQLKLSNIDFKFTI